jgi:hypothetical protein
VIDALLFERRPGVRKGSLLLLELPLSPLAAVRSYRSWSSATASAAALASRAAFRSSASLAFCSSVRARSSAWLY